LHSVKKCGRLPIHATFSQLLGKITTVAVARNLRVIFKVWKHLLQYLLIADFTSRNYLETSKPWVCPLMGELPDFFVSLST
jgi:hypothetical protein